MHGSAEFFAPLIVTRPLNARPPMIRNLSMLSSDFPRILARRLNPRLLGEPKRDGARDALQVTVYVEQSPVARVNQRADGLVLVEADFEQEVAARLEVTRRLFDEASDDVESVAAGRQGDARLVLAHLALESFEVTFGDVWRVRGDEVEAHARVLVRVERVEAVGGERRHSPDDAVARGVRGGDAERGVRDVERVCARVRSRVEQRDGDAAGACANVAHAGRLCLF